MGGQRPSLKRFKPSRNGYTLVSEPSAVGIAAERRAYELLDFFGITAKDPHYTMFFEAARRSFKEHARDQRHLCSEALLVAIDCETDGHAAVMNAPEPGTGRAS